MSLEIVFAIRNGDLQVVESYLAHKGDPNYIDDEGTTILILAINNRQVEMVYLLLEAGADEYLEIMDLLIQYGADINYVDPYFGTPLHEFARPWVYEPFLEFMLEKGADPNIQPGVYWEPGWTPLHFAVRNKNVGGVELLLKYGAQKNMKAFDGRTPMDFAKQHLDSQDARDLAIIDLLK